MNKIVWGVVCVFSLGVAQVDMNKPLPLSETFKKSAETMNKSLPMMMDTELRHDKVDVHKNTMILKFTLVNFTVEDISAGMLKELMEEDIRRGVCADAETQDILNKGMTVVYDYSDKNKQYITQFEYDAKGCEVESNMAQLKDVLSLT